MGCCAQTGYRSHLWDVVLKLVNTHVKDLSYWYRQQEGVNKMSRPRVITVYTNTVCHFFSVFWMHKGMFSVVTNLVCSRSFATPQINKR